MRAGSQDALAWVIEKYGAYVSTIVWNIIGKNMSIADVEEVSSDVFFALWNQIGSIQTSTLRGYLAGIARNMAKSKLRQSGHDLSLEENIIIIDDTSLEAMYEAKEINSIVRHTIDLMKAPEREIFMRYYFYYQTMDLISKEMGINLSTVKTKLRRTKELLKQSLLTKLR